jgi:sulfate-transporting ATPase
VETVLLFALLGVGSGVMYALAAFGIVLIHRASGVINFATGSIGMAGTFVYWELRDNHQVAPLPVAMIAGIAFSGLLGLVTHLLMRLMKRGSNLMRVVLTLAVTVLIQGALGLHYDPNVTYPASSIFPTGSVHMLGGGVGIDRLSVIGLAVVITAIVWAVYRFTRFGLATSAVSENPLALSTLGWSSNRIAAINWTLGGGLSALAGILLSPLLGVSLALATSLLLPSLAAAVLGNLSSFPLTLAGGAAIGIAQSEILKYVAPNSWTIGLGDVVPFLAIIVVVLARGRALPLRNFLSDRLPRVTSGQIRPLRTGIYLVIFLVFIFVILPDDWVMAVTTSLAVALILLSIVLVTGYAGQISLAQWTVAGVGALVASQLVAHGMPYVPAILLGVLSGAPVGAILGLIAIRARGLSLAIATLGFSVCVVSTVFSSAALTGGAEGLNVGSITIFGFAIDPVDWPRRYAVFTMLLVLAVALMLASLRRGRAGRRLLAIRANERAAAALGVDVRIAKIAAFSLAASVAALGGIVSIFLFPVATFDGFDAITSIQDLTNAALGGIGFVTGPLIGSQGAPGGLSNQVLDLIPGANSNLLLVILGVLTLFIITQAPDGASLLQSHANRQNVAFLLRLVGRKLPERRELAETRAEAALKGARTERIERRPDEVRLDVRNLTVQFGTVRAIDDLSFELVSGEVLGVIGPNGAGKTTLIDAITGFVPSRSEGMRLGDTELSRLSVYQRSTAGLSRSFQSLELFEDLTVLENILVACDRRDALAWASNLVHSGDAMLPPEILAVVCDLGLDTVLGKVPSELPLATRNLVAFVRAIATRPSLILLDEPAAGLDDRQRQYLGEKIRSLADEWGMAVLLIEHDVDLVCALSDHVLALDFGKQVTYGRPDVVRRDPRVLESYLGIDPNEAGGPSDLPDRLEVSEEK